MEIGIIIYSIMTLLISLYSIDTREDQNIEHVWIIHKNEKIRKGNNINAPKIELWKRSSLTITNRPDKLLLLRKYEILEYELEILNNLSVEEV